MTIIKYKLRGRSCSLKVTNRKASKIIASLISSGVKVTAILTK